MGIKTKNRKMKIAKILTVATCTNAASIHRLFGFDSDPTTTTVPTTSTTETSTTTFPLCDCCDGDTTASTTTEELTTTLEPESTYSTTTDGNYTPPDSITTTMTSTELTSTTKNPLILEIDVETLEKTFEEPSSEEPSSKEELQEDGYFSSAVDSVTGFFGSIGDYVYNIFG